MKRLFSLLLIIFALISTNLTATYGQANMRIEVKTEKDLAIAKQIFLSLHFDGYILFTVEQYSSFI